MTVQSEVAYLHLEMMTCVRNFYVAVKIAQDSPFGPQFHRDMSSTAGHWLNRYIECWDKLERLGVIYEINLPPIGIRWDDNNRFEEPKRGV